MVSILYLLNRSAHPVRLEVSAISLVDVILDQSVVIHMQRYQHRHAYIFEGASNPSRSVWRLEGAVQSQEP